MKTRNQKLLGTCLVAGFAFAGGYVASVLTSNSHAAERSPTNQDAPQQDAAATDEMQQFMQMHEPGEHHKRLSRLIGTWDAHVSIWMAPGPDAPTMDITGTVTREWVLGDRFVKEVVDAETPAGSFQAVSYLGYNNATKQYESIWMENASTEIYFLKGSYIPEDNALFMYGEYRTPEGAIEPHWSEFVIANPDRQVMTGWSINVEGERYKSSEIVFERRKDDAAR